MPSPDNQTYRERWFHAEDGLRLYYRDYGDPLSPALPLVCLCGFTRNARDYHPLASREAARRRVVCPDYRGRGRSAYDPDVRNYQPQIALRDLTHLLAAAKLGRVLLCGTSYGGLLVMGLAVMAPATIAGVILNEAGPDLDRERLAQMGAYVGKAAHPKDWTEATAYVRSVYADMGLQSEAEWLEVARSTFREEPDGRLALDYDLALGKLLGSRVPDLWRLYRALRPFPALAIRGEISGVLSEATFARMRSEKPDLLQATIPGVGHTPRLTEPESIEAIDGFLEQFEHSSH